MTQKRNWLSAAAMALALAQVGCGDANFNKIFGSTDEGGDTKLQLARSYYDVGKFEEAEDLLTELIERNEDNEGAAVLLGYTYLSTGGIDPFQLARKLIEISKPTTTTTTPTTLTELEEMEFAEARTAILNQETGTTGTTTGATASTGASNTSTTLLKLGSIVSLSEADHVRLRNGFYVSSSGLFAADTVPVPREVTEELRASVKVLHNMNRAVKLICRFVDDSTKVAGDPRDQSASCAQTSIPRKQSAKAHFLWAFSHLTEAMVYQSVLLYSTIEAGKSNFEVAGNVINTFQATGTSGISEFVSKVTDLKKAVDTVFDVANANSMISSTLRDILAVNMAFQALAGLPESMTKSITTALSKLEEIAKQFGGGTATVDGQTKALKGQMIEKFSKTVGAKINDTITKQLAAANLPAGTTVNSKEDFKALQANPAVTAEQKTKLAEMEKVVYGDGTSTTDTGLCGAYTSISDGLPAETVTSGQPGLCK